MSDHDESDALDGGVQRTSSEKKLNYHRDISFVGNYVKEPVKDDGNVIEETEEEDGIPDGGWGWLIVFVTFLINALVSGTTFTLGVSIPPLWDHFQVSEAKATVVGSVMVLAIMSSGPFVGFLVSKYGCRPVMCLGGIIHFIGAFSCTYSQNLSTMIALFGFVGGVGLGFIYIPAIIIIGYYFKNRIALASGVAMCGTSVGTFAFNPLREYLQDTYGWNTSTAIFATYGLLCTAMAMFLRLPEPEVDLFSRIWNRFRKKENIKKNKTEVLNESNTEVEGSKAKIYRIWKSVAQSSPLGNPLLLAFLFSSGLSMMGFAVPLVFMGEDGKDKGISSTKAVFLFSIIALSDGVGRFALGVFCQKTGISPLKIKTVWIAIASVSSFLIPFFKQYVALACFSALIGLGYGSYIAMILPIFVSLVEKRHIPAAVGAENLFSGISIAICAPVAGALYGAAGNLSTAFYYSGSSLAAAVLLNFAIMFHLHYRPKVQETYV